MKRQENQFYSAIVNLFLCLCMNVCIIISQSQRPSWLDIWEDHINLTLKSSLAVANSQLPAVFVIQSLAWKGAEIPTLGCGVTTSAQAGVQRQLS